MFHRLATELRLVLTDIRTAIHAFGLELLLTAIGMFGVGFLLGVGINGGLS